MTAPGSRGPALKATTESKRVYLDPSEGQLQKLLDDVERGVEGFVVFERLHDATGQTFLQLNTLGDDFVIEYRDGGPDKHFQAFTPDKPAVWDVLSRWTLGLPGWNSSLTWEQLVF